MDLDRIANLLNGLAPKLERFGGLAARVALVMGIAYVAASTLSAWMASGMLSSALAGFNRMSARHTAMAAQTYTPAANYHPIVRSIRDRNVFNSAGDFPEESSPDARPEEPRTSDFNMDAPCTKPSLNVELVGTIYADQGISLATLQERGYSEADVYREGDLIIGSDDATVVKIERNRVILNNQGKKECIELAAKGPARPGDAGDFAPPPPPPTGGEPPPMGEVASNECLFEEKFVQDELGPGFGTIIQKARLVPNTTDNVMNGFKIFAIDGGSLLGKTGLQNGDIITQVNETSLKQPEQGFALYQAFQDEKEVRIHILRRGTTPMTIVCRIK